MEDHYRAWQYSLNNYSVGIDRLMYFRLEGMGLIQIAKKFIGENKINKSELESIVKEKEKYYLINHKMKFFPGSIALLERLKDKNICLGLVTSGQKYRIEKTIPKNVKEFFDVIVTASDTIIGKPYPDPYEKAVALLNKSKNNCIVVENAPLGIQSAKNAGLFCVAISSTLDSEDLVGADEIIDTIDDLLDLKAIQDIF